MEYVTFTIRSATSSSSNSGSGDLATALGQISQTPHTAIPPSSPVHQLGHNGSQKPRFQCMEPGCLRLFNRKYTLTEHIKTHTGEKPFICPVQSCSKRFTTSGNLSRHKRVHGPVLAVRCSVSGCECSFANDTKLEKHMKFHLGIAEHVCLVPGCGKTFSTLGNHNRHMRNQHTREECLWAGRRTWTPISTATTSGAASPSGSGDWSHSSGSGSDDERDSVRQPSSDAAAATEPLDRFRPREPWNPAMLDALSLILEE